MTKRRPRSRLGDGTFDITNDGPSTHEFVVVQTDLAPDALPVEDGEAQEDSLDAIGDQEDIAAGTSTDLSLTLDPGRYVVFCNVTGHYEQGTYSEPDRFLAPVQSARFLRSEQKVWATAKVVIAATRRQSRTREEGGDMQGNEMDQGGDGGMHTCPTCGKSFDSQQELMAHQREAHEDQPGQTMPETGE